jgi:hypothetical protein
VGAAELRQRPLMREGELLEAVPGMIVTQHSGDGKANQLFVRGFNLDHGTDFQTRLEGMPLNMASHAHGQGYTDLNFLIPEFVDHVEYRLGVSHTELGDFGSAGGAEFTLRRRLDRPFLALGGGAFGLARAVGGASIAMGGGSLLVGGEARGYEGPWRVSQDLRKYSGIARWTRDAGASRWSVLGLAYRNRWNASDQIPMRAVRQGAVTRFGQLDPTLGGSSERYSLSGEWSRLHGAAAQTVQVFAIASRLDLFSNFTYFLDDPEHGDQINQRESRRILGANLSHRQQLRIGGIEQVVTVGLQHRTDVIADVGLHRTRQRTPVRTVRQDDVTQAGTGLFVEMMSRWRPWVRSVVGLRGDAQTFDVRSIDPRNSDRRTAAIASPRASLVLTPASNAEVYVSAGFGFHSNDARGTTITVDPATGEHAERVDPLVRSRGAELGLRLHPITGLRSTVALWSLDLDSELLFVGDGGTTEPSAGSRRHGVTFANFWRAASHLTLDADVSFARARLRDTPAGNRIPGALERVVAAGVTWTPGDGSRFATLRLRHFGAYPLIEDNRVRATPTTLLNAETGATIAGFGVRLTLLNVLGSRASDIQYYYTSRLAGETQGVEDVHFHPVEPRQLRLTLVRGL